ncbi:MAG TPA: CoA-binding protein [Candidatus Kapabacteria bacterium]|nr:CoA-binding protein [Candidatus Kapabacteria bacterium]
MRTEREILEQARVIAVVGCSDSPTRDSYRIAAYLQRQGYRIIPVNPTITTALGETAYPDLASVPEKVDLVNVFRRSDAVPGVVDDAIAARAPAIWLQLGIRHDEAEKRAREAGLDVVSDRCIAVEYRLLGIRGPLERE